MRKISFRIGIIQIFLLFLLVTFAAISGNYYFRTADIVLSMGDRVAAQRTHAIVQRTRAFLDGPVVYTANLSKRLQRERHGVDIVDSHRDLWELMWEPLTMTTQLQSYFVADRQGSLVEVRRDARYSTRIIDRSANAESPPVDYKLYRDGDYKGLSEERSEATYDPRQRPWFSKPGSDAQASWTPIFLSKSTRNPILVVSYPMLSDQGEVKGSCGISLPLYYISDFLAHNPLTLESRAFITRADGDLLAFFDKNQLMINEEPLGLRLRKLDEVDDPVVQPMHAGILENIGQSGEAPLTLAEGAGGHYRLFVRSLEGSGLARYGWKLLVLTPQAEAAEARGRIDAYLERVMRFFRQPEDLAMNMAHLYPRDAQPIDVARGYQQRWREMWDGMRETPQIQSVMLADLAGGYLQARREPYLATRLIDRSTQAAPPVYDLRIYRDEDYAIYTRKRDETAFDPRDRSWYRETTTEERIHWQHIHVSSTARTAVITATYPLSDPSFRRILRGVTGVSIPLHSISDFVAEEQPGAHGMLFIFDDDSNIIAYPDKSQLMIGDDSVGEELRLRHISEIEDPVPRAFHQNYQANEGAGRFRFEIDGQRHIAIVKDFPAGQGQWDWKVATIIAERDLLGNVDAMLLRSLWIALAILLIALAVLYFITSFISNPINRLADEADKLRDFRLDSIRGVESRYKEIDHLSRALLRARDGLLSFRKYVPEQLVRQLIRTNQSAELGGKNMRLTVFFSDIQGFTTLAEGMPAQDLLLHLSEYFDEMTSIITKEGGTIDKYIGDSIMAFWGAPVEQQDAPHGACRAALRCQRRLDELNTRWLIEGKPELHTRIGIHTGSVVVGNVGASQRFNYTVVGDNVNLASRLEGVNSLFGTRVIISEATRKEVAEAFVVRLLDRVAVKGKRQGTWIYELVCSRGDPLSDERRYFIEEYEKALASLGDDEAELALQRFKELAVRYLKDKSIQYMIKRCRSTLKNREAGDLDKTWILTMK